FLQEAYKALRAIASVTRRDECERLACVETVRAQPLAADLRALIERLRSRATGEPMALDEAQSKEVLRAYGIATPAEELVGAPAGAVAAAERIGYPVVLKVVSAELTHKSELGAVALDLATPEQLAAAYARMAHDLRGHRLAGMLVCRQIRGGLELALGLNRDP